MNIKIIFPLMMGCLLANPPEDWSVDPAEFEHTLTVTAQLSVHDTLIQDSTKWIGAFINNVCRGVNQPIPLGENWITFLMVYGNSEDSLIHFQYYDSLLDSVFDIEETLSFIPNGSEGTPDSPFIFHGAGMNLAPVAYAGSDQTVGENETVQLDGTASTDYENTELTYVWVSPATIDLDDETSATPTFISPMVDDTTVFLFTLVVFDGELESETDSVVVTVINNLAIETDNSPYEFKLYKPYPNPFNPITTIRFSVEKSNLLSLRIYDITGRLVDELVNGELPAGEHEVVWNASTQPSGVYFVQLVSGNNVQSEKVLLIK